MLWCNFAWIKHVKLRKRASYFHPFSAFTFLVCFEYFTVFVWMVRWHQSYDFPLLWASTISKPSEHVQLKVKLFWNIEMIPMSAFYEETTPRNTPSIFAELAFAFNWNMPKRNSPLHQRLFSKISFQIDFFAIFELSEKRGKKWCGVEHSILRTGMFPSNVNMGNELIGTVFGQFLFNSEFVFACAIHSSTVIDSTFQQALP